MSKTQETPEISEVLNRTFLEHYDKYMRGAHKYMNDFRLIHERRPQVMKRLLERVTSDEIISIGEATMHQVRGMKPLVGADLEEPAFEPCDVMLCLLSHICKAFEFLSEATWDMHYENTMAACEEGSKKLFHRKPPR